MSKVTNQRDISQLKYLVVWTYEYGGRVVIRTQAVESEIDVHEVVFHEALRFSVMEKTEQNERWKALTQFVRDPNFKVEVLSLSLAKGFDDANFANKLEEAIDLRLREKQEDATRRFKYESEKAEQRQYATYLALKAKYEKNEAME